MRMHSAQELLLMVAGYNCSHPTEEKLGCRPLGPEDCEALPTPFASQGNVTILVLPSRSKCDTVPIP